MNHVLRAGLFLLLVGCGAAENSRDGGTPTGPIRDPLKPSTEPVFKPLERSMIRRAKDAYRALYTQIQTSLKANNLPPAYEATPTPEEIAATPVVPIPHINREVECGLSADNTLTVAQRIADCSTKINQPSSTFWSAKLNGISGEGNWRLVTYTEGKKVWQDTSTNLLWSDIVGTDTFPMALGLDPAELGKDITSLCTSLNDNINPALGKLPLSRVKWRLPNREEFLQADINGARSVLTDSGLDLWTASYHQKVEPEVDSNDDPKHYAWVIDHKDGILKSEDVIEKFDIRCIGVVTE